MTVYLNSELPTPIIAEEGSLGEFNPFQKPVLTDPAEIERALAIYVQTSAGVYKQLYTEIANKRSAWLNKKPLLMYWPLNSAEALINLGSFALSNGVLESGAAGSTSELLTGATSVILDGVNDTVNTNYKTQTNLCTNPLKKWSNFFSEKMGTTTTEEKEGYPTFVTTLSKVSESGSTQFIPVVTSEKARFKVVAGEKITVKMTFNVIETNGFSIQYGMRYVKSSGSFLSIGTIVVSGLGVQTVSHTFEVPATAELEFAQAYVIIQSPNSAEVKKLIAAWKEPIFERGTTVGAFFPTLPQLASGEAGWAGGANESESDLGAFARGTKRTFIAAVKPELAGEDVIFGVSGTTAGKGPFLSASENGTLNFRNGAETKSTAAAAVAANAIHVVSVTYDSTTGAVVIYVDGVSKISGTISTGFSEVLGTLVLGHRSNELFGPFKGKLIPFAVYPTILSATELLELN